MAQLAVLVSWGAPPDDVETTEAQPEIINFLAEDLAPDTDPIDSPIQLLDVPVFSCERWLQIVLSDLETNIGVKSFRMWRSPFLDDDGYAVANIGLNGGCTLTYTEPVASASVVAVTPVPESDPGPSNPNITVDGSVEGIINEIGEHTDWIVLQLRLMPSVLSGANFNLNFAWVELL